MSSVDERIVRMKIENSQLLSGVKSSQTALSNLNKSVDQAGKSKGMTALGNTVDTVKHKFSLANAAALTVVGTITNKLVNAGISLVKSLTLDPIIEGFHSYQTTIDATKTIMANTGKDAKTTGKYLRQLQDYANKTVYSFGDMAKNIGTFTAAGVKLPEATKAIQGIANVAAMSGSNTQQASSAMYQLSQALAAGQVHLQDWNSVVNAGMGGKALQTALIDTGIQMGTISKSAVKFGKDMKVVSVNGEAFRQSLTPPPGGGTTWLTSGVLSKTLATLGLDMSKTGSEAELMGKLIKEGFSPENAKYMAHMASQSYKSATQIKTFSQLTQALGEEVATSWGNVFKTLIGGLGPATHMLSAVHIALENALRAPVDGLNRILQAWVAAKGRTAFFQGFVNIWTALGKVLHGIGKAWKEAFPSATSGIGKTLAGISEGFANFTKALIPSGSAVADIRDIFKAVFDILGIGVTIVKDVIGYFASLFGLFIVSGNKGSTSILSVVAAVARMISSFLEFVDLRPKIDAFFGALEKARAMALEPIIKTIYGILSALNPLLRGNWSGFVKQIQNALTNLGGLGDWIDHIGGGLVSLANKWINMGLMANPVMRVIIKGMRELGGWLLNAGDNLKGFFKNFQFGDDLKNIGKNIVDGLTKGLDGSSLLATFKKLFDDAINFVKNLLGIHSPSTVFAEIGKNIVEGIGVGFKAAFTALKAIVVGSVSTLVSAGHAIGEAWHVVGVVFQWLGKVLGPVGRFIGKVVGGIWDQFSDLFKGANAISFVQIVQTIFSGAALLYVKKFADNLTGFLGVFNKFGEIGEHGGNALKQLTSNLKTMQHAVRVKMLLDLALAIGVLSAALWVLSQIPADKLAISLTAVTFMMGELIGAMHLMSDVGGKFGALKLPALAGSLILMATALTLVATAVLIFGHMKWETIKKGFAGITASLALMVGASVLMSKFAPNILAGSAAMVILSFALDTMVTAIMLYNKIPTKVLVSGLIKISATIATLAFAMSGLSKLQGNIIRASIALGILSISLNQMAKTLTLFGHMNFFKFIYSLGLIVIGIATLAAVSSAAAAPLTALGIAMALIGAGIFAVGAGLALAGVGIAAIAAGGTAAMATLVAGIQIFLASLPLMGIQFIAALTTIIQALAKAMPKIVTALVSMAHSLVDGFIRILPDLRRAVDKLIEMLLGVLTDSIGDIVQAGVHLIQGFLEGIRQVVPDIVHTGVVLIKGFLRGVRQVLPDVGRTADVIIDTILGVVVHAADKTAKSFLTMLKNGLDTLAKNVGPVITKFTNVVENIIDGLSQNLPRLAQDYVDFVVDMINAAADIIDKNAGPVGTAFGNLGGSIVDGIATGIGSAAKAFYDRTIGKLVNGIVTTFKNLLGIHSPSTVFARFGGNIIQGLINGIGKGLRSVWGVVTRLANGLVDNVLRPIGKLPEKAYHALGTLGSKLAHALGSAFSTAAHAVTTGVNNVFNLIAKLPGKIRGLGDDLKTAGSTIIGKLLEGLKHAGGFITGIAGNIWDVLRGFINSAIHRINEALEFKIPVPGLKDIPINVKNIPDIPGNAKGTDNWRGGLSVVGELGPELVSMPGGSSVITNKNLVGFMRSIAQLSKVMSHGSNRQNGSIIYNVSADFHGDPKASGVAFAANLVSGLANGMKSGQRSVNRATADSAQGLIKTFADELGIHSPSKVFHGLGLNVAQGFLNGLITSLNKIKAVGVVMARTAVNTVAKESSTAQQRADALQARADALRAAKMNKAFIKAATKNMSKTQKTKYLNDLNKEIADAQQKADSAQGKINSAAARAKEAAREKSASAAENANVFNSRAKAQAAAAEKDRKKALMLEIEANRVRAKDSKLADKLHKQAIKAAKAAGDAADAAKKLADKATGYATTAIQQNTASLANRLLLDTGTPAEIAEFWHNQYETFTKNATDDYAKARKALDAAKAAKQKGDIVEEKKQNALANKWLTAAEAASQKASDAADAAANAAGDAASSADMATLKVPQMTVSSNAVHGAQSMFDAYSKSLAAVTSAAAQPSVTVNLEQNNNSPQSLSASEIYRNTKNILSTTERKLNSVLTG